MLLFFSKFENLKFKMEAALKKTQIAHKYMCFIYTLKAFFKDEFKSGQSAY